MKYLISLLFCILLFSCGDNNGELKQLVLESKLTEFSYQDCEYILMYGEGPCHKGNCSNPIHCYNKIED